MAGEIIGQQTIPTTARAYAVYRTPIRDREGDPIYWRLRDDDPISPAEEHCRVAPVSAPLLAYSARGARAASRSSPRRERWM